jgi:hypothetical protein
VMSRIALSVSPHQYLYFHDHHRIQKMLGLAGGTHSTGKSALTNSNRRVDLTTEKTRFYRCVKPGPVPSFLSLSMTTVFLAVSRHAFVDLTMKIGEKCE